MKEKNKKLRVLYDLLVDNKQELENELISLILSPNKINDTNRFASLLSELKNPKFVNPLLERICIARKSDLWLTDFLYAAINLLEENSVEVKSKTINLLINKLGHWILEDTGELSWKSARLLEFCNSKKVEQIQLKKLELKDFYMTHIACISGLMRYNEKKYLPLVTKISMDKSRDKELRLFCKQLKKNYS